MIFTLDTDVVFVGAQACLATKVPQDTLGILEVYNTALTIRHQLYALRYLARIHRVQALTNESGDAEYLATLELEKRIRHVSAQIDHYIEQVDVAARANLHASVQKEEP